VNVPFFNSAQESLVRPVLGETIILSRKSTGLLDPHYLGPVDAFQQFTVDDIPEAIFVFIFNPSFSYLTFWPPYFTTLPLFFGAGSPRRTRYRRSR